MGSAVLYLVNSYLTSLVVIKVAVGNPRTIRILEGILRILEVLFQRVALARANIRRSDESNPGLSLLCWPANLLKHSSTMTLWSNREQTATLSYFLQDINQSSVPRYSC